MPRLQAVAETPDRRLRNLQIDDARSVVERCGRRQLVPEVRYTDKDCKKDTSCKVGGCKQLHHTFLHRNAKPAADGTDKVNTIRVRPAPTMQVSRAEARINHLSLSQLNDHLLKGPDLFTS